MAPHNKPVSSGIQNRKKIPGFHAWQTSILAQEIRGFTYGTHHVRNNIPLAFFQGHDSMVGLIQGRSDQIVHSRVDDDNVKLARYLLHEMTHLTVYRPGESPFNESLANFVGDKGADQFFDWKHGLGNSWGQKLQEVGEREKVFENWLNALFEDLGEFYESGLPEDEIIQGRDSIFQKHKDLLREKSLSLPSDPFRNTAHWDWNNALVLAFKTYRTDPEVFEMVFRDNGGSLRRLFRNLQSIPRGVEALDYLKTGGRYLDYD